MLYTNRGDFFLSACCLLFRFHVFRGIGFEDREEEVEGYWPMLRERASVSMCSSSKRKTTRTGVGEVTYPLSIL